MTPDQIKAVPQFAEHWPHVAPFVDDLLTEQLIATCAGVTGGDNAQSECGSVLALAKQIKLFRAMGQKAAPGERPGMRPLRRHSKTEKPGGQTTQPT